MKASTPAKGSRKRASAGKAAGKPARPAPKTKKAAAPAKQATATRRVAVPRPKPKAVAKPAAAKRTARPAAGSRAVSGKKAAAPPARRAPSAGRAQQPKPTAVSKRPAVKAAVVAPPAKRPAAPAKEAPQAQAKREDRTPAAAKTPAVKLPALPAGRDGAHTAAPKPKPKPPPPAAPKPPAPAAAAAAVAAKPKPPPRGEAGSSAEAPVRIAPPLATVVGGSPPPQAGVPARPPIAPPMGSPGLARALPHTHVVARREAPPTQPPRPAAKPVEFKSGDHVVYPTHGVGTVQGIETMSAAGLALQVIVVTFDENRMTLRVPVGKAASSGLRKLASAESMTEALDTLRGRARVKRTMWSRRAQEYEAKINSGDPVQIAEVVRDLHRNAGQPDQSFSERQIYEQAMDRLAAELAAIDRTDKPAATEKLLNHLNAA
jgi:CarD family transcriptional regulator